MGIPITNGLNVNAPFPADLRTFVGTGMVYASKEAMALAEEDYLFNGLQVHDNDTHITYEYVIENSVGTWVNVSFGATILAYNTSGVSLKLGDGSIQGATNSAITFTALYFGNIESVSWSVPNSSTSSSEQLSFSTTFATSGNYSAQLTVTDIYGNTESSTISITIVETGVINITGFTVTPLEGFSDSYYGFDFSANLNQNIQFSDIDTLSISYVNSLDTNIEAPLTDVFGFISGVSITSGILAVTNASPFSSILLDENTTFTLTCTLKNGDSGISTVVYNAVNPITINSFSVINSILGGQEYFVFYVYINNWITGSDVSGEIICSESSIIVPQFNFSGNYYTTSVSSDLLTANATFTLETTHTVGDYERTDTTTYSVSPSYEALDFNDTFDVVPENVQSGVATTVTFTATANKTLHDVDLYILDADTDAIVYTVPATDLSYISYSASVNLSADKNYKLVGIEGTPLGTSYSAYSNTVTIYATEVTGVNPVFWNSHYDPIGTPEEEKLWPLGLTYNQLRVLITDEMILASPENTTYNSVTQPRFTGQLPYGSGGLAVDSNKMYYWIALPKENPDFPLFTDMKDSDWIYDAVLTEFYVDDLGNTPTITLSIDGTDVDYYWYIKKPKAVPVTFYLGNVN